MFEAFDYRRRDRPLGPDDLSLLHAVLTEYCKARQCNRKSEEALAAARELIRLYQAGVVDREVLVSRLYARFPI
ncbi:hypothetical protein [Rhizobium leucaenae]|uniref:Uncharacterized protein n=1 Tax=Rhizobium leucaenae TaxID=29450 RepID=A0A7W7EPN2_9HYPH|nr:hypothetical protein [Rhizobium leucaenae]MBB4571413.1 hypothetical protein [Rhizobium leucaenae]MBB6305492.1 hypothetical protein [Rhizobium leucaenae]